MLINPRYLVISPVRRMTVKEAKGIWESHIRLKRIIRVQNNIVLDGCVRVKAAQVLNIALIEVQGMEVQVQGKTYPVEIPEGYVPVRGKVIRKNDLYLNGVALMSGKIEFKEVGVVGRSTRPADFLLIIRRKSCSTGSANPTLLAG